MLRTYEAILRDDQLEWSAGAPSASGPIRVHVTLLETELATATSDQGRRMADALAAIANAGGIAGIEDPLEWQKEVRQDRSLPGRTE
jgi:hypothetical protein